jgi:CCDC81-like prokaryotic HU domain 2
MYDKLYSYLVQHKELALPGIGTLTLGRQPAQADFGTRSFRAPVYSFAFDGNRDTPSKKMFSWLAGALHISDWEAVKQVNEFSFDIKKRLQAGKQVELKGVGALQTGLSGELKFEPVIKEFVFDGPVTAEKVLRENAQHTMLVGEQERTSAEMTELLSVGETQKDRSWIVAALLALLAVIFIGWHFSERGVGLSSLSNGKVLAPHSATPTYKVVQSK